MKLLRNIAAAALLALGTPAAALAAGEEIKFPPQIWSFSGPFGTFDRASAQRGFQVYSEVCSACHAVKQAYYRDLKGIGLSEKEVEAIAAAAAYVEQVTRVWRAAIDQACASGGRYSVQAGWSAALARHAEGQQHTLGAYDRPWR